MTTLNAILLPLTALAKNDGQIDGLPANPRFIKDDKFAKLKTSIQENPEMLALRELLVYPIPNAKDRYIILGGNMRYSAMVELGYTEAPCKVIPADATIEQLRAYTLKDNSGYGGLFCHIGIGLVGRCIGNHLALGCAYCVGLG